MPAASLLTLPIDTDKPHKSSLRTMLAQRDHLTEALRFVRKHRIAIDGGAHCGLWSDEMARHFAVVLAFEPAPDCFVLLRENLKVCANIVCYAVALGHKHQTVSIPNMTHSSLSRYVLPDEHGIIQMIALDELHLTEVDFLKLDLEGAEPWALEGAKETIQRSRPVILVEDKNYGPKRYQSKTVTEILVSYRYYHVWRHKPDHLWLPQ